MQNAWEQIINQAAEESITDFSEKASSFVKLTNKEIEGLIPKDVEHSKFAELMQVVNNTALSNQDKAEYIRRVSGLAEISANLIAKIT